MIRLRCETGIRPRDKVDWMVPRPIWLDMALGCAQIQAHSLLASGRRRVDLSRIRDLHSELDLMTLYEAGILELVAWDEHDRKGTIVRIKYADLSQEAGLALASSGMLPGELLATILAPDLLPEEHDSLSRRQRLDELAEWGGLTDLSRSFGSDLDRIAVPPIAQRMCAASF